VKEILPKVREKLGDVRVMLAGASPHKKVLSLADNSVIVTGWIDDMRKCYNRAKLFIAPMTIGTGLQNKLLEAMAMNLPCITSKLANDALGAKHKDSILVGNSSDEFAGYIAELLLQPEYAHSIALRGQTFVREKYSWDETGKALNDLILGNMN
jgi:glycosyltransferase involved in cell wall biosynthesis